MPFNGSGIFLPLTPEYPAVDGTPILADDRNALDQDFASGLSNCMTLDGQSVVAENLPMNGKKFTDLANGTAAQDSATYGQLTAFLPTGIILDFAGTVVPAGFLACDGSAVSRTTYANLWAAIGATWGAGDGSTTFNVPDLRRRTTIGSGGVAVSGPANTTGATGGAETVTLTSNEMPTHSHGVTDPQHSHGASTAANGDHAHLWGVNLQAGAAAGAGNLGESGTGSAANTSTAGSHSHGVTVNNAATGITIQNAGSGNAHTNMQPSAVVTKIIKT